MSNDQMPLHAAQLIAEKVREQASMATIGSPAKSQALAGRMAAIRRAFPTLGPRVTAALALGGYDADDSATKTLAAAEMVKHTGHFWDDITSPTDNVIAMEQAHGDLVKQWSAIIQSDPKLTKAQKPEEGFVSGALDEVGNVAGKALQDAGQGVDALSSAWKAVAPSLQGGSGERSVTRNALAIPAETGEQAIVGAERNVAANIQQKGVVAGLTTDPFGPENKQSVQSQTSGGIAIQDLASGQPVPSAGSGFMPSGPLEQQQAANARAALSVNGQAWTIGRATASMIFEPGSLGYQATSGVLDAAHVIATDPTNQFLGGTSDLREAGKGFTIGPQAEEIDNALLHNAGRVDGIIKTTHPPTALQWLTTVPSGVKFVKRVDTPEAQGGPSFLDLFHSGLDAKVAAELHGAAGTGQAADILKDHLGITTRLQPTLPWKTTQPLRDVTDNWRILGKMPSKTGDLQDTNGMVENLDRSMRNGKVPVDIRNDITKRFAVAADQGREAQMQVLFDHAHAIEDQAAARGESTIGARSLTQMYKQAEEDRHFMIDLAGQDVTPFITSLDGTMEKAISPAYFIDFANRVVPFPDAREVRKATDIFAPMHGKVFINVRGHTVDLADSAHAAQYVGDRFMNVWKPAMIARLGLPMRVLAETQTRMAMDGYNSILDHPIKFFSQLAANPRDLEGNSFKDIFEKAANTGDWDPYVEALGGWGHQYIPSAAETGRRLKGFTVMSTDSKEGIAAWHERISRLSNDPFAREIARNPDGLDAVKQYFTYEQGNKLVKEMLASPEGLTGSLGSVEHGIDPTGVSEYIDNLATDLHTLTQDDPALWAAVGKRPVVINGKVVKPYTVSSGKTYNNPEFTKYLSSKVDAGDFPQKMIGQRTVAVLPNEKHIWNRGMQYVFDHLMTMPNRTLNKNPTFLQSYYDRLAELSPVMSSEHRAAAAAVAEEAGFKDAARTIRNRVGEVANPISPPDANLLAKRHGLDQVQSLLYDLHNRGQFSDIFRNIFPFAEAFKEMSTKWAKVIYQHPETLRKFQVAMGAAKSSGFFFPDQNGNMVFNYPGSAGLTNWAFGAPVPLTGQVTGLNAMLNGLPTAGPAVQIPASYFIPDTPRFSSVRNFVMPFGEPDNSSVGKVVDNLTPPWMSKIVKAATGPESDSQFAQATMAMAAYLHTTGKYGPNDQARLLSDAKADAQQFFVVRALGNLAAPAAPIPNNGLLDKDGNFLYLNRLKDEYNKDQVAGQAAGRTIDQTDQDFIQKYGPNIFGAMQPFTRALVLSLPVYPSQIKWAGNHPAVKSKFPDVYGFFAPLPGKKEKFDDQAYKNQIGTERQQISPTTWNRLFANKIATHIYYQKKALLSDHPTKEDRDWLSGVYTQLTKDYPGFGNKDQGVEGRATPAVMIDQMTKAVKDPALKGNKTATGIQYILQARNQVIKNAADIGIKSWQTAAAIQDDRDWLYGVYARIRNDYPGVEPALNMVFAADTAHATQNQSGG